MWQFLCVVGIAFVILEIFTPSMFFLNFALAAFITAAISYVYASKFGLVLIFFVLSFLSFAFLRPLLLRRNSKETETGISGKYIGKSARVTEDVTDSKGVITIMTSDGKQEVLMLLLFQPVQKLKLLKMMV